MSWGLIVGKTDRFKQVKAAYIASEACSDLLGFGADTFGYPTS
jgi:hypothetical protein